MTRTLRLVGWLLVVQGFLLGVHIVALAGGTPDVLVLPAAVVAAVVAGLLPLLASLLAICDHRSAARLYLWVSPFAILLGIPFTRAFGGPLWASLIWLGAIALPGVFWRIATIRNWPQLLAGSWLTSSRRIAAVWICGLSFTAVLAAVFWSLGRPWWPLLGDCSGRPVLDDQGVSSGTDFTARVLFVGPRTFQGRSLWSIARIERRFSAKTWWTPNTLIVRGYFRPSDVSRRYFVEGRRSDAALTRFLPVIEPEECGHTGPIEEAAVAVRILEDGPPKSGVRLIGRVYKGGRLTNRASWTPLPGIAVSIEGPTRSIVSFADTDGIYDEQGLPPGRYRVRLLAQNPRIVSSYDPASSTLELKVREVRAVDFNIR